MSTFSIPDLIFFGVATATAGSAAYAVFSRNIVRAVFALLGTFFGVALIYGMLAADFVAVVQVMVYVGGILVLMLFAVMLTSNIEAVHRSNLADNTWVGFLLGAALLVLLASVAIRAPFRVSLPLADAAPTTDAIGEALLGPALLPFSVVSLLLSASVIGAVTLARRRRGSEENG